MDRFFPEEIEFPETVLDIDMSTLDCAAICGENRMLYTWGWMYGETPSPVTDQEGEHPVKTKRVCIGKHTMFYITDL